MIGLVSMECVVLSLICLTDMLSTLLLVSMGIAVEQNPLMAACLRYSPLAFVLVKIASFVPFVIVTERYRRQNPRFARIAVRAAIILYICTYAILTARTNVT